MKANATSGGGKKPVKRVGKTVTKKPSVYGKNVPTTSVGGGRVKYPTKKSAAAARSLVGNAALMVVPGGAAVKGALTAAKYAKAAKALGSVKGTAYHAKTAYYFGKAEKVAATNPVKSRELMGKARDASAKANKEFFSPKATAKQKAAAKKYAAKKQVNSAKQANKTQNKSTLNRLKSSGAIKRMK